MVLLEKESNTLTPGTCMKRTPIYLPLAFCALTSFADAPKEAAPAKVVEVKPADAKAASTTKAPEVKAAEARNDTATPAAAALVKTEDTKPADTAYNPKQYIGVAVTDAAGNLQFVAENPSQTHSKENYVMVKVKGIKVRRGDKEKGRVRIAVWDTSANYAKEGTKPFRASSHWAKDSRNGEMTFKIAGLEKGKSYSFFAHFDKENRGFVKKILGIPVDPFLFTSAKTQGAGPGLTREGLSPPKFENTLVTYHKPGQDIVMEF